MPEFASSCHLLCSAAELREYLGATANLTATSDPELELEIMAAPECISEGDEIEFRITAHGFKQRMRHRYVTVSDREIVAEQVDGPAKSWIHRQAIQSESSGCELLDEVTFEPPGGMLGFIMTEDRIRESLQQGMDFRYETLQNLFGAGAGG